jgi:DNA-binding cell septation regulator SpoVG
MEVKNVKTAVKPPCLCSFDVTFIKMGMTIRDLRLMETHGKKWLAFPSRSYQDGEKTKYFAYVGFEKGRKEDFEKKIIELLQPHLNKAASFHDSMQPNNDEIPF